MPQMTAFVSITRMRTWDRPGKAIVRGRLKKARETAKLTSMPNEGRKKLRHQARVKIMHDGLPVSTTRPVGVSLPVARSTRKATMLWLSRLAA